MPTITQQQLDFIHTTVLDASGLVGCNCALPTCEGDCTHAELLKSAAICAAITTTALNKLETPLEE
jgi:hypothetical protein